MSSRRPDDDTIPFGMRATAAWAWRLLVIAAALYVLLRLLSLFIVLVAPVLIALLLVALVRPLTDQLSRVMPRGIGALVTVLAVIALVAGLITLVSTQVASGFPELQRQAEAGVQEVREWLAGPPLRLTTDQLGHYLDQARASISGSGNSIVTGVFAATSTAGHVVAGVFIALFSTYFFLAQGESIWHWVLGVLPRASRGRLDVAAERGWVTLTSFVRATVLVALVDAVGIGTGAALLGVPLAVPLAVLVFLGSFIPVVGALISGSVAVLIALVTGGLVKALLMLAVVIGVQQVEAHVLQPFLLGRAVSVHPLAVILGIAAGALVAGILGALFAVPLIAVGNTMLLSLTGNDPAPPQEPIPPKAVDDASATDA
ncbi:AI-2E family transporter [Angustibacter sp. McL0619]|uniref:AI-2E family transporter n=1 Tax=Angustibacter sp. McL0619 TaxID=3415676 RepID=UPI003CF15A9A